MARGSKRRVLFAVVSGSFCSRQAVMNKCFRCDAIGLAMLGAAAAECGSCWGCPRKADNQINQRTEQIAEGLSKWCWPRKWMTSCADPLLFLANQEDKMSIAGRKNGPGARIGAIVLPLLFASCGLAGAAHAQAVGAALSGLITDEHGGAVPGATVSIKNVATGVVREVSSNADGFYSAPNLLPGAYEVRVTSQGFQTLVQKEIVLTVGAQQALNLSLKVGQLNQTVEVSAAPPEVQTASSTIGATVDSTTVRELPLNGRDW